MNLYVFYKRQMRIRQHFWKYSKIEIFGALNSLQIDGEKEPSSNEWIVKSKTSQNYLSILNLTAVQEVYKSLQKNHVPLLTNCTHSVWDKQWHARNSRLQRNWRATPSLFLEWTKHRCQFMVRKRDVWFICTEISMTSKSIYFSANLVRQWGRKSEKLRQTKLNISGGGWSTWYRPGLFSIQRFGTSTFLGIEPLSFRVWPSRL